MSEQYPPPMIPPGFDIAHANTLTEELTNRAKEGPLTLSEKTALMQEIDGAVGLAIEILTHPKVAKYILGGRPRKLLNWFTYDKAKGHSNDRYITLEQHATIVDGNSYRLLVEKPIISLTPAKKVSVVATAGMLSLAETQIREDLAQEFPQTPPHSFLRTQNGLFLPYQSPSSNRRTYHADSIAKPIEISDFHMSESAPTYLTYAFTYMLGSLHRRFLAQITEATDPKLKVKFLQLGVLYHFLETSYPLAKKMQ